MEAVHGFRVSECPFCAAAGPKVLLCCRSIRILTAGPSFFEVSLWLWAETSDGKVLQDLILK